MERLVSIGEAASALGVSITTLRRWEASGKLVAEHTAGGHRRYDLAKLRPEMFRLERQTNEKKAALALLDALVSAIREGKNIKIVIEDREAQA